MNIPKSSNPRIVIIGGGFAGLALAKKLKNKQFQVVLLDKHNYHTFQPLLYQVATGGLEPDSIAYPIRKVVQDFEHFYFRLAEVKLIDTKKNKIIADIGELTYDYLVLATGSKTNFFGNNEISFNCMSMKSIPESLNIRSLILENFEQALLTNDLNERESLMNFVLVGGGPTGVELAGALAEMKKGILPKDYPDLDVRKMQINLIQSSDKILNGMSEKSSQKSEEFLKNLGVNIWKNLRVTGYDSKIVTTNNSEISFNSDTVIWTAGVKGALIKGIDSSFIDLRSNRIKTTPNLQIEGHSNIFAIGDISKLTNEKYPNGLPMMAQPAIQQGKHLAKNLELIHKGKPMIPFEYADKGSMATIGRNKAVVDLPKFHFSGFFAWVIWMFVHLFSLIGFKIKAVVFLNWVYNYIRFDREARLIIRPYKKKKINSFTFDEI